MNLKASFPRNPPDTLQKVLAGRIISQTSQSNLSALLHPWDISVAGPFALPLGPPPTPPRALGLHFCMDGGSKKIQKCNTSSRNKERS